MTEEINHTICNKCKTKCVKIGKYVTIKGIRKRYKCQNCGRTYTDPFFDVLFTKED